MLRYAREISKAEFVRRITSGKSLFLGISSDVDNSVISKVRQSRLEKHKTHSRSCIAKSNYHLVFEGDSHLTLKDVKPHTFIKCYVIDDILIVEQKWLDIDWTGYVESTRYKYLYYTMEI